MKTELWNGHEIRFVEKGNEWWAVLKDVTEALGLKPKHVTERLRDDAVSTDHVIDSKGRKQKMLIVNEFGIYETIFSSRKEVAKKFKLWVYGILKELRKQSGIEGFQIFKMMDTEHQKTMMGNIQEGLKPKEKIPYIKANSITDKAISNKYGYPKMIKKDDMTAQMLTDRQQVLEETVELMILNDKFNLNLSISEVIYKKYS